VDNLVAANTTDYNATDVDEYIGVYSSSDVIIKLPFGSENFMFTIKDEFGVGSGNITIKPKLGETINNKDFLIINSPYQSVCVVFNGNNWNIV
jgi:hypothetical protein